MKSFNILATKLFIPKSSAQVIQRERLTELLQNGLEHKVTLISAPAGFGKSTLVSEWLREQSRESAWYSVDISDNEPTQFLTYFISALQNIRPSIGKTVLEKLQSPALTPIESMLTGLINELVTLKTDIVLVLDDYHTIDNERIHQLLTFLIESLPDTIHLLILTRFDPPIPLARMRSQNLITDIRAEQLAFTSEETSAFCKQVMKKNLTEAEIYEMHNRTEGWIAGLALANLSLKGTQEDKTILKNISGSNRHIVDYLMEEVLNNLPKSMTDFLIHTSIFKRFNADLCNVVLQRVDSLAIIDKIEAMNTFIFALDNEHSWFRYHHLFADLLKQRLKLRIPEEVNVYHQRAAIWLNEQGFKQEALYHALEASHFSFAAEILEDMAELNWEYGFQSNIFQWIQRLPEEIIQSRVMLNIALAKELMLNGRFEQAVEKFESIESNLQKIPLNKKPANQNEIIGKIAASRAFLSICTGDIAGIIEHAELALQNLPEKDLVWRGLSASLASIAYYWFGTGNTVKSIEFTKDAIKMCELLENRWLYLTNCLQLAIIQKNAGHLNHVLHYYEDLLKIARENEMESSGVVGGFYSEMGDIYSEQYNFETAAPYLQKGLENAEKCKDSFLLWTAYKNQARSLMYQNKFQEALNAIERINVLVEKNPLPPWFTSISNGIHIQLLLKTNKLDQAVKMIEAQQLNINNPIFHFQEAANIAYARVLIEQGNLDDALALLDRLLEIATADNRGRPEIEMHILKALTLANQNQNRNAVNEMCLALSKAQNNSFISIFISENMSVKALIQKAIYSKSNSATFSINFAEKVIEIFELKESISSDILSERELEVMQCVASGMKNSQIADSLFVSMNTIKTHLKNIMIKLEVKNRTEAVTQGRRLGWLKK